MEEPGEVAYSGGFINIKMKNIFYKLSLNFSPLSISMIKIMSSILI
jgi:hypothetical protein